MKELSKSDEHKLNSKLYRFLFPKKHRQLVRKRDALWHDWFISPEGVKAQMEIWDESRKIKEHRFNWQEYFIKIKSDENIQM